MRLVYKNFAKKAHLCEIFTINQRIFNVAMSFLWYDVVILIGYHFKE